MKGEFICFIGIDGSGKTTLAHRMVELLSRDGIKNRYVWGGHELWILKPFVKIVRKLITRKYSPSKDYNNYHSQLKALGTRKILFYVYQKLSLIEYLTEILFKIRIPLWIGYNIVADRYIFDYATNIASNYALDFADYKKLIENVQRVCPKPDICYFVDVSEEIAMKRKNDTPSIEYIKIRREYYKYISEYYNFPVLDGESSIDSLVEILQKNTASIFKKRR